jgi:hypothetical protein
MLNCFIQNLGFSFSTGKGMATYAVTYADDDNWGEPRDRFKTRAEADGRIEEVRAIRRLVRLVRWENNVPTEVLRIVFRPNDFP